MMSTLFIGFSGKIGTGKTTVANLLADMIATYQKNQIGIEPLAAPIMLTSFGQVLKEEVASYYYLSDHLLYTQKGKNQRIDLNIVSQLWNKELIAPAWQAKGYVTPREILQWYATEYTRDKYPDYWIKSLDAKVKNTALPYIGMRRIVIVDDVRFPNELEYISKNGLCFRLEPYPGWEPGEHANHISETALDDDNFLKQFESKYFPTFGNLEIVTKVIFWKLQEKAYI